MIFSTDLLSEMGGQILAIFKVSDQNDDVGSRALDNLESLIQIDSAPPRAIRAAPEKFVFREADAQYLGENFGALFSSWGRRRLHLDTISIHQRFDSHAQVLHLLTAGASEVANAIVTMADDQDLFHI